MKKKGRRNYPNRKRRVSCRQLVDLGTSLRDYIKRSICNPGKRGLNRNRTVVRARKIGLNFGTKLDGKS